MLVENDAIPRTYVQEPADLEEMGGNISSLHDCIVHASDMVLKLGNDCIQPLVVPITTVPGQTPCTDTDPTLLRMQCSGDPLGAKGQSGNQSNNPPPTSLHLLACQVEWGLD